MWRPGRPRSVAAERILKTYRGLPRNAHDHADLINADLLSFLREGSSERCGSK